ncbi:sodium/proline symporter [bacterium]|nr:sodium/proline symporter [bacterium]
MDILIAVFMYATFLIGTGLYFYKKTHSASDYLFSNRSLNYWVTAISAQASDMSSWLFLALPGAIYQRGLFEAWFVLGLIVFMYLNWHFVAPKLRLATANLSSITLPSYFAHQLKDKTGRLQIVSTIVSLFFFLMYIASGLVALGRLFQVFGIPYRLGMSAGIAVSLIYTLFGGLSAVAWSDLFQGLFLLIIIVIVPIKAFFSLKTGSFPIATVGQGLNQLIPDWSVATLGTIAATLFSWGPGYFGQPHILINFMTIDNPKNINKAKAVGISWQIICLFAGITSGLVGLAYFGKHLADPELVFIRMSQAMFNPFVVGFVLCAILAATISTLNTQIIVAAAALTSDVYQKFINQKASQRKLLQASRLTTILLPLIGYLIALNNTDSIFKLVNYAWSGLGSAFGPLVVASLYTNRITTNTAMISIIAGALISGLWPLVPSTLSPLLPGFTASSIVLLIGIIHKK